MISFALNSSIERFNVDSFFDVTQSWTKLFYMKQGVTTPGADNRNYWTFGDDVSYTDPYIYVGSDSGSNNLFLELWDGTTLTDTVKITPVANQKKYVAVTYDSSLHILSFYHNNTLIGTISKNLSTVTFVGKDEDINNAFGDCSVGYFRDYQRCLTLAEIILESASITPVSTTNLLTTSPLQSPIDLTDHNQTKNVWTTLTPDNIITDTDDPLLSIVAGPPTNTTPANATLLTIDSAVFQDVNTAGTATDVWYRYPLKSSDFVLSILAFGDLTTFKPNIQVYNSLANANLNIEYEIDGISIESARNKGIQFPVPAGLPTLYFRVVGNGATPASTLKLSLLTGLNLEVPVGSIGINQDNTQGWPLVLMDQDTGYPIHFVLDWPGGNGGCTLKNGKTIFGIETTGVFKIFNSALSLIATIDVGVSSEFASGNLINNFVVVSTTDPPIARIISENGVLDPISYTLSAGGGCQAIGLSRDSTIIYYVKGSTNKPIKRWNVTTNTAMADLTPGIAGYFACKNEIVVLDDNSIVVNYARLTPSFDEKIVNYSAAGAVLHTYNIGPFASGFAGAENRIAGAVDNLNQFWSWIKFIDTRSTGQFRRIRVSDGSILKLFSTEEYDFGNYQGVETNTPKRFGNPDSCPFFITRVALLPSANQRSGIYTLTGTGADFTNTNPRLTHDVVYVDASVGTTQNMSIPTPFGETFLAGNE